MSGEKDMKKYWKKNISYVLVLMVVWFLVSYVFGIFLKPVLPDGVAFWFAQQGSMIFFVIIIFVYVRLMNKLDKDFDVDEK
jgi:putative solute:sodium symporter small subunit